MKLLAISLACVLATVAILCSVRFWGQGQVYSEFENSFFKDAKGPIYIARANSLGEASGALLLGSQVVFWLDVRKTLDDELVLIEPKKSDLALDRDRIGVEKHKGRHPFNYNKMDLQKFVPGTPTLAEILQSYPQQKVIINVIDNVPDIHKQVVDVLEKFSSSERFLIQSDTHVVMTSIKERKPLLLYGTSTADIMRLLSFESLFILPAAPFVGDVYISPFSLLKRNVINLNVLNELKHRKKKIILGPITSEKEFKTAVDIHPDGYFFENPEISHFWLSNSIVK